MHFKEAASNLTLPLQLLSDGTPFHKSWHVKKIIVNYFTYLLCFGFFFFSREKVPQSFRAGVHKLFL